MADAALPVFLELRKVAAAGEVLKAFDTKVKILDLVKENKALAESQRRGLPHDGDCGTS